MIIYTWPRTRGNATLMRARAEHHLIEPFGMHSPWGIVSRSNLAVNPKRSWPDLEKQLMHQNTASKILGINLHVVRESRAWWVDYCRNHTPYVLFRNLRETAISYLVAKKLGWTSYAQQPDKSIEIEYSNIDQCRLYWECFLNYAPNNGRAIEFNLLPEQDFNPTQTLLKPQDYQNKFLTLVKNPDEVLGWVNELVRYYEPEFTKLRKHYDRNYI